MKTLKVILSIFAFMAVLSARPRQAQTEKPKSRVINSPTYFVKSEGFLELSEADRATYTAGLMDGFFASTLFGATEGTVQNLHSCTEGMDLKQISAIITKYLKDNPESWHVPLSVEAHNALNKACPGVLRVTD